MGKTIQTINHYRCLLDASQEAELEHGGVWCTEHEVLAC